MYIDAVNVGIRAREVDVLHGADGQLRVGRVAVHVIAIIVHNDDFTRADVAHELRTDNIQRAGFGRQHIRAVLHASQ